MFFNKKTIYLVAKLGEFRIFNKAYIKYAYSSITTVIKESHVITLYYYGITSRYIRYSGNND
jgi:hypothetical protein